LERELQNDDNRKAKGEANRTDRKLINNGTAPPIRDITPLKTVFMSEGFGRAIWRSNQMQTSTKLK
jgi:hypothetical protein